LYRKKYRLAAHWINRANKELQNLIKLKFELYTIYAKR
jgi:hypothetical protein